MKAVIYSICAILFWAASPAFAEEGCAEDGWKNSCCKSESAERPGKWRGHSGWGYGHGDGRTWWRCPGWKIFLGLLVVLHLLLTIIVFKDIRRSAPYMNSLWVVVVLMGGLPATVAYAVFRLALAKSEPR